MYIQCKSVRVKSFYRIKLVLLLDIVFRSTKDSERLYPKFYEFQSIRTALIQSFPLNSWTERQ